jgi:hypothetical protein
MPKYLKRIFDLVMSNQADKRENRLKQLSQTLHDINRRDMDGTLSQLSLEFYKHVRLAEDCVNSNEIGGAEGHMLIAESIHDTLKTLEVKQRKTDR